MLSLAQMNRANQCMFCVKLKNKFHTTLEVFFRLKKGCKASIYSPDHFVHQILYRIMWTQTPAVNLPAVSI